MRRIMSIVIVVALVLGLAAYALRGTLALTIMRFAAERAIGADAIAEFPDGLHVVLCGAGSPLADPLRSGPCVAVIAGVHLFEVDVGDGAGRNLTRLGLPPGRVEALFLTHFHSDHIDGLGELTVLRWAGGNHKEPLPVFGPTGVEEVVAGFNAAYRLDATYRIAHHGEAVVPPSGTGGKALAFDKPADGDAPVLWNADGLIVRAFGVHHNPVQPAVGYRFDYGGRSVVISGDTAKSANLEHFAAGADVLVHEGLSPELVAIMGAAATKAGRTNIAKVLADIQSYHTAPVEVAEIAAAAKVHHLLFYHVIPPLRVWGSEAAFLKGVDAIYHGLVTLGRDGTQISLPRDSNKIIVSQRAM
jgi:ribonuclease Z